MTDKTVSVPQPHPKLGFTGRIIWKNQQNFTVTSCSICRGSISNIHVYDPVKNEYIFFDSQETFENWAYGTPVPSGLGA